MGWAGASQNRSLEPLVLYGWQKKQAGGGEDEGIMLA